MELDRLLSINGYKNYETNLIMTRDEGQLRSTMDIKFKEENK